MYFQMPPPNVCILNLNCTLMPLFVVIPESKPLIYIVPKPPSSLELGVRGVAGVLSSEPECYNLYS